MTGKPIDQLNDQTYQSIIPTSCSDYKDCFALDVPKWATMLYKAQDKSYLYVPVMPNKPTGR